MKAMTITLALLLLTGAASAQTMGVSGGHDLDALWARAQDTYDLAGEDAVILLESRTVTVGDEGTLVTRVHRVVWIGTGLGIRAYADLRVPWNSDTSTLEVELLRTWMDGRWWPDAERISDTAVVHTLPHALRRAHDYTAMRETMLLHDGVELPCIMETAYTIAEQVSPTAGADDLFVAPQADPAVVTEYVVRAPLGTDLKFAALNGAPEPVVIEKDVTSLVWTLEGTGALRQPPTAQPEAYEPAIVWSTWESWETLEAHVREVFTAAAVLEGAAADSVQARTSRLSDPRAAALAVLEYVDESTRAIPYGSRWWRDAPRPAGRVWETGYGHAWDRAVLAAAALRLTLGTRAAVADDPVRLVLAGDGDLIVANEVPRLTGLDHFKIQAWAAGSPLLWAAETGGLEPGTPLSRRPHLVVAGQPAGGSARHPGLLRGGVTDELRTICDLTLQPGPDGTWSGRARVDFAGAGALHNEVATGGMDLGQALAEAVGGVLTGLEVTASYPELFSPQRIIVGLETTLPDPAPDDRERTVLTVGSPHPGALDRLGHEVSLADESRATPVISVGIDEMVILRVELGDREATGLPGPFAIANSVGGLSVECAVSEGWLSYRRHLEIKPGVVAADAWPELRALLLEHGDAANGTIVLE